MFLGSFEKISYRNYHVRNIFNMILKDAYMYIYMHITYFNNFEKEYNGKQYISWTRKYGIIKHI